MLIVFQPARTRNIRVYVVFVKIWTCKYDDNISAIKRLSNVTDVILERYLKPLKL